MYHVLDGNAWQPALEATGALGATDRKYGRPERPAAELWKRAARIYNWTLRHHRFVRQSTGKPEVPGEQLPTELDAEQQAGKYALLLAGVRSAYAAGTPDQAMIDMDHLARLLRAMGHERAYVEQTGGGCATLYSGTTWRDEQGDDRQMAVVGPGSFFGLEGWTEPLASTDEFYLGRDDDGTTTQYDIPRGASDEQIAELIDLQIRASQAMAEVGHAVARVKAQITDAAGRADGGQPLVSDAAIAEAAAIEERDRAAGGPPWEVPDHPDHELPGGWHQGQIR